MASTKKNTHSKKMTKKNNKKMGESVDMYCVRPKCRKMVHVTDAKKETLKNGRCMMRGTCPGCKGKVTKFVKC